MYSAADIEHPKTNGVLRPLISDLLIAILAELWASRCPLSHDHGTQGRQCLGLQSCV